MNTDDDSASVAQPPDEGTVEPEGTVERIVERFLDLRRRGSDLQVEQFAEQNPGHRETLQAVLPAVLAMEQLGSDGPDQQLPLTKNQRFGEFRVMRLLGRGGMGAVYEAIEEGLERRVALKVLSPGTIGCEDSRRRFLLEARSAAQLVHDHIVPVFRVGHVGDCLYYAMQLIEGVSLAELINGLAEASDDSPADQSLRSTPLPQTTVSVAATEQRQRDYASPIPPDQRDSEYRQVLLREPVAHARRVARIGRDVARALHHSHQHGIIHRDIKPSNILIDTSDKAWVTDFGIARHPDATLTRPGAMVGTLRYMAPEQFRGEVDPRTDVWGLGLTLYELLTLQPAYRGGEQGAASRGDEHLRPPPAPHELCPDVPRDLEAVVLRAMAGDPGKRYPSADELADDLQRFLDQQPVRAIERRSRRSPARLVSTALILILILIGFLILGREGTSEPISASAPASQSAPKLTAAPIVESSVEPKVVRRLAASEFGRDWFFAIAPGDDREVAQWVFDHDGKLSVITENGPQRAESLADLPRSFNVMTIDLWHCRGLSEEVLRKMVGLPKMTELILNYSRLDERWMPVLLDRTMLTSLQLAYVEGVTDRALETIGQLAELQYLNLNGCAISDAGITHLAGIPQLCELTLYETSVTDEGLGHLQRLQFLELLDVGRTGCSAAAVDRFRESHPRCLVQHNGRRKRLPGHGAKQP